MKTPLQVLIVEDSEFDAQVMVSLLRKAGYDPKVERVETAGALRSSLERQAWDVILADYNLPEFNALAALQLVQESHLDIPFIIVSGGIGEDIAVAAMKGGAHDYLMKGNLSRLAPAVERELREAANRTGQRQAKQALQESEMRYRLLWETSPDAVVLIDTDHMIQFVNPAVEGVFGHTPGETIGHPFSRLLPERLRSEVRMQAHLYFQTRAPKETIGLRKDGSEIPIEINFGEMELNGHRRFVGFIRDITERKKAEQELRENQEQFRVAREIQQRLFPKAAPDFPGFEIAGASYPAEATGGDYFDFLPMLNNCLGVVVGDVSGHGVGPALLMAETRAYLRVLTGRRENVGEILTRTNEVLAEDVGEDRFVTLFIARLTADDRSLAYASAGHPAGYVLDSGGNIKQKLARTGVPLGMVPNTRYAESPTVLLAAGDLVVLLTDGIEESLDPDESMFGTDRALEVLRASRHLSARQMVEALYKAVGEFARDRTQVDDITAIIIKVK